MTYYEGRGSSLILPAPTASSKFSTKLVRWHSDSPIQVTTIRRGPPRAGGGCTRSSGRVRTTIRRPTSPPSTPTSPTMSSSRECSPGTLRRHRESPTKCPLWPTSTREGRCPSCTSTARRPRHPPPTPRRPTSPCRLHTPHRRKRLMALSNQLRCPLCLQPRPSRLRRRPSRRRRRARCRFL